ncbi:MAG: type II toxin-antitoxin system HicB family antitoxin [Alphaproteobacteria bacterium]|nr:type II toxin-antitoxin system HicB family antitoxin [Alphaproteobacteria bacterium]
MMNTMHYEQYVARIEYDEASDLFHGRVLGIKDVIEFYGKTTKELHREFKVSIEEYKAMCQEDGVEIEKPFSGKFTLRVNEEEHRQLALAAELNNKSLNSWASAVLREAASNSLK